MDSKQNKDAGFIRYEEVKEPITNLLKEFGPRRQSYHPEEPFVRLTRDGIWNLSSDIESVHINNSWISNQLTTKDYSGYYWLGYRIMAHNEVLYKIFLGTTPL